MQCSTASIDLKDGWRLRIELAILLMGEGCLPIPVWLIASTFEPRGRSLYTLRLAQELGRFGFQPTIVCETHAELLSRSLNDVEILRLPMPTSWFMQPFARMQRSKILSEITTKPALIHAQRRRSDPIAAELAHLFRCPYLLTLHDEQTGTGKWVPTSRRPDAVIAISPTVQRDLSLSGVIPSNRLHVIPSGVELSNQLRVPRAKPVGQVPVIAVAGALEAARGYQVLLKAAEIILSSGVDAEFLVIGRGPEEERLRELTDELDIASRVTFVSQFVDFSEVLEPCDVFVVPSLEQGLGSIMLEAMALAKPVVASAVGGIADYLVDGVHALLVAKGQPNILAEKILQLLDDQAKARRLATAGLELVREKFTVEHMTRATADLYHQLLQSKTAQAR